MKMYIIMCNDPTNVLVCLDHYLLCDDHVQYKYVSDCE